MHGNQFLTSKKYALFPRFCTKFLFQLHPKIRLGEIDPSENIGVLLVEFFELYGQYLNYQNVGIDLNKGGSYFLKMQKGWLDMSKPWLLSISDPTDDSMYTKYSSLS
jgi:DNA polymerase sigma